MASHESSSETSDSEHGSDQGSPLRVREVGVDSIGEVSSETRRYINAGYYDTDGEDLEASDDEETQSTLESRPEGETVTPATDHHTRSYWPGWCWQCGGECEYECGGVHCALFHGHPR